jgi:predicted phosphoribosyltransferase
VPVASSHAAETISQQASWVCLHQTEQFGAIGEFYQDFKQVETPEAVAILNKVNQSRQQK